MGALREEATGTVETGEFSAQVGYVLPEHCVMVCEGAGDVVNVGGGLVEDQGVEAIEVSDKAGCVRDEVDHCTSDDGLV